MLKPRCSQWEKETRIKPDEKKISSCYILFEKKFYEQEKTSRSSWIVFKPAAKNQKEAKDDEKIINCVRSIPYPNKKKRKEWKKVTHILVTCSLFQEEERWNKDARSASKSEPQSEHERKASCV